MRFLPCYLSFLPFLLVTGFAFAEQPVGNTADIELGPAGLKLASGELGQFVVDALLSDDLRRDATADAKIVSILDFNPRRNKCP